MILGLPIATFFWVVVVWALAVVAGIVYALTYKDSDEWLTIEDIIERIKQKERAKDE